MDYYQMFYHILYNQIRLIVCNAVYHFEDKNDVMGLDCIPPLLIMIHNIKYED